MILTTFCYVHIICSVMMTGIIWIIQQVHYPGFRYVDVTHSNQFHKMHTSRISIIVAPLMLLELSSAIGVAYYGLQYGWLILLLNLLIWLSTFFLQVPLHNKLETEWNPQLIDRLISTNWIRTILWTAKTILVSYYVIVIL